MRETRIMPSITMQLILYGTYGCHLCEQARELVLPFAAAGVDLKEVDILDDPALEERYGIRIPVLLHPESAQELGWPFDHGELEEFIRRVGVRP
jgi:hypothetical protein